MRNKIQSLVKASYDQTVDILFEIEEAMDKADSKYKPYWVRIWSSGSILKHTPSVVDRKRLVALMLSHWDKMTNA